MFKSGDTFRSNGGAGPGFARIVAVEGVTAVMERFVLNRRRAIIHNQRIKFELPLSFLSSPNCGWAKTN